MSIRLGFFIDRNFIPMHATVGLMVIDTQQAIAVWKLASPAFGGGLQCLLHVDSFRGVVPHRNLTSGQFRNVGTGVYLSVLYIT